MQKSFISLTLALVFAGTALGWAQPATRTAGQWIEVLKSDVPLKEKVDACRELGLVGGKEAIEPLAQLLGDEQLSHMARYGLEMIPGSAVNEALRQALGKVEGRNLAGVITSLGVRRDRQAVPLIIPLLDSKNDDVAQAAARALGAISAQAAVKELQERLPTASGETQLAMAEALLRIAENMMSEGRPLPAVAIYTRLSKVQPLPHQVRAGIVRGRILAEPRQAAALIREALQSPDYVLAAAAARAATEMRGRNSRATDILSSELGKLPPDRQILVILALGRIGSPAALPALSKTAQEGPLPVRLAALRAIPEIGSDSAVPVLLELLKAPQREVAQAALEGLGGLPGGKVDQAVADLLSSSEPREQLRGIELTGRRRLESNLPALLKAAQEGNPQVSSAALRRVSELGGPEHMPALLNLLRDNPDSLDAVEQALGAIAIRSAKPEESVELLVSRLDQASPEAQGALLRVMAAAGGPKALETVRKAARHSNAEVRSAAISALSTWRSPEAAPDLLVLAKSSSQPADRSLALRGYLNWAANPDLPVPQRLEMCREAAGLVQNAEEKRRLLASLGSIPSREALDMILPHLEEAATRNEAAAAVVSVGEKLIRAANAEQAGQLVEPLQKAAQATDNSSFAKRLKELTKQALNKSGTK